MKFSGSFFRKLTTMKRFYWLTFILLGCISIFILFIVSGKSYVSAHFSEINEDSIVFSRTTLKAEEAIGFCKTNGLNTGYCILVDMNIHSGKKRMFVWDFKKDSIIEKAICTHGCCKGKWADETTASNPIFSNTPDSHCSSIGKYKIGVRGYSNWGIHINYKLHGLEKTNNNAYKRFIVLHSWDAVSDEEVYPNGSPESWGCPAVSNNFMKKLDDRLSKSSKPVLLWIYQ